jgi:hypothetical protein
MTPETGFYEYGATARGIMALAKHDDWFFGRRDGDGDL